MKDILILSTGGTFNKIYNKINGNLEVDNLNQAIKSIENNWLCKLNYKSIINKDSLDFTDDDREFLAKYLQNTPFKKIVVIHGTDTMHLSANVVYKFNIKKSIVFTGAMVPFSINPIEATANLASAIGFIKLTEYGVYISMNGVIDRFDKVIKNKKLGKFELQNNL